MRRAAKRIVLPAWLPVALGCSLLGCGLDPLAPPGVTAPPADDGQHVIEKPSDKTVETMARPASWVSLAPPTGNVASCRAHYNGQQLLLFSGRSDDCDAQHLSRDLQWRSMSSAGRPELSSWWAGAAGEHLVVYGYSDDTHRASLYSPEDDSWSDTAPFTIGIAPEQLVALSTESKMIMWGGFDTLPDNEISTPRFSKYDPMVDDWRPLNEYQMVTPRYAHGAVWDSHHMFVFGGYDYTGQLLNDAGLYDDGTDSWEQILPDGAPSPRHHAAIAWTGFIYVVFGGTLDGDTFLGDGGQYCPEPCWAWSPLTAPERFAPRHPKALWTGEHVIVMQTTDAPLRMQRYWVEQDSWEPIELPPALDDFVVVDAHWDWQAFRALLWGRHSDGTMRAWLYNPPFVLAPNGSHPGADLDGNQTGT